VEPWYLREVFWEEVAFIWERTDKTGANQWYDAVNEKPFASV
jgi:hypothetical protein